MHRDFADFYRDFLTALVTMSPELRTRPIFTKSFVHVTCGRGSVLL